MLESRLQKTGPEQVTNDSNNECLVTYDGMGQISKASKDSRIQV